MIAITLRQPHAAAAVFGCTRRLWRPKPLRQRDIREPILIVAGRERDLKARVILPAALGFQNLYGELDSRLLGWIAVDSCQKPSSGRGYAWRIADSAVFADPPPFPPGWGIMNVPDDSVAEAMRNARTPERAAEELVEKDPDFTPYGPIREDGYVGD